MITINRPPTIPPNEISSMVRRICDHLGIAFTANRVLPHLADLSQEQHQPSSAEQLNAIGKAFGIRFREMSGTMADLLRMVSDSGPVVIGPEHCCRVDGDQAIVVLRILRRSQLKVSVAGVDRVVSSRWLKKQLQASADGMFRWLLVQPMLAAENASRFHYQSGTAGTKMKPLRRLVSLLKPEAQDIRTILIFSIVIGLLSLTTPLAVEAVVNTIAFGRYLQPLIILSLIVLVFLGFRAGLSVLMTVVTEIIQRKLFVRTVEDLSYRLTRVPLSSWKKYHGPELVNRFFDIVNVQKITSKLLLDSLMLLLQTVIGLTVLAFYHPFLLGYDIGLLALMTVALWLIGRGAIQTALDESSLKYDTAAWLQEIVRHPATFKFNGGLGFAINRADELAAQYINHRQSHFRILLRQISFSMFMQVVAATVLLALGGYLVIEGQLTLGQLVAAELIVTVILGSFAKIGKDLESFYDLMASVDKLGKLFDLPIEEVGKLQLTRRPGAYGIRLVDVQFENVAADPSNIEFSPGYSHAIWGCSELNREVILETLVGQRRPRSGYVLLDEYRVDAISAESLQGKISMVRNVELFVGSVDENIRMGRENIGSAAVNDVVEKLHMRKTISALENGFAEQLAISGYPLSQGEAIRLTLARALISKPGVLFIDGLLDRLSDEDTEDVLQCLDQFKSDTTIIVSTGRRAIARWADQNLDASRSDWKLENFDD